MRFKTTKITDDGATTTGEVDTQAEWLADYSACLNAIDPAVLLFWVWDTTGQTWAMQWQA